MRSFPLLLALSGCTWITSADVDREKKSLDEDADGFPSSEDCDDQAKNVFPGAEDAWYDGIDSDCAGDDDDDQDADGVKVSMDCDDQDPAVFPSASDAWYDGVDSDCGGEDDYDQDDDGWVADAYLGLPTAGVDGSGLLKGGDCDDTLATAHPEATDAKYDGVDSDCAGNDDFDQDADGHVPVAYVGSVTRYVEGSGLLPADDCDDGDAASYPGATEIWYDGVDQDCVGGNDYDQDGDGWVEDRFVPEIGNDLPGGECDDLNAEVHPGGVEDLSDGAVDGDCDGDPSGTTLLELDGFTFADGHNPILLENSTDLWLSVVSSQVRYLSSTWYQAGIAFSWPLSNIDNDDAALTVQPWSAPTEDPEYVITGAHAAALDGTTFYGAVGQVEEGVRRVYVARYESSALVGSMTASPATSLTDVDDLAMVLSDTAEIYLMACSSGQAASWIYLDALDGYGISPTRDDVLDDVSARACALEVEDDSTATLLYSDGLNLWDWAFDPSATSLDGANGDHVTGVVLDVDTLDTASTRWRVLAAASFGGVQLIDQTGASWIVGESGDGPSNADADIDARGDGVVAWINNTGGIRLAIGGVSSGWSYYDVPSDMDVDSVAVKDVDGTVMVAAAGNDGVGIAVLRL